MSDAMDRDLEAVAIRSVRGWDGERGSVVNAIVHVDKGVDERRGASEGLAQAETVKAPVSSAECCVKKWSAHQHGVCRLYQWVCDCVNQCTT